MRQQYDATMRQTISQYREAGCCTVVALACSMDWSFGKAHRWMKKHGRKNRAGMRESEWSRAIKAAAETEGKKFTDRTDLAIVFDKRGIMKPNGMTIGRFCKEYPKGTFYVKVRGHALCIKDGVMMDWTAQTAARRPIISLYKLEG